VIPPSGSGEQPLLAQQPVNQSRLARVGPADHRDAERLGDIEVAAILIVGEDARGEASSSSGAPVARKRETQGVE